MSSDIGGFPRRILVLEDDPELLRTISLGLEKRGLSVVGQPSGVGAEATIASHQIEAVVTDLYMPEREGLETIHALARAFPTLPLIALTASNLGDVAAKMGAWAVLRKPIRISELVVALRSAERPISLWDKYGS